jgi:hypothetical protein
VNVNDPIHLVTGDEPARGFPMWAVGAAFGVAVAFALLVWLVGAYRAHLAANQSDHAFRALANAMRIGPGMRSLIRRLALAHPNAAPAALLLSGHALAAALRAMEGTSIGRRDRRRLDKLRRAFGLA